MRHYLGVLAALALLGLYVESRLLIFVSALGIMFIVVLGRVKIEDEHAGPQGTLGSWGTAAGGLRRQQTDTEQVTRSFRGRDGSLTVVTETVMDGGGSPFGFGSDTSLIPEPLPSSGFVCRGRTRELVLFPDQLVVRSSSGDRQESVSYHQVRGVTFTRLHGSAADNPAASLFAPVFRVGAPSVEHGEGGVLRIDLANAAASDLSLHSLAGGEQHDPLAVAFEAEDAELFRQASSWLLARSAGVSVRKYA